MPHTPFRNAHRAGLYHLPSGKQAELSELATKARRKLLSVDLTASRNKHQTLLALGKACAFPDYYGANLDALHDCLTDPEWRPASGLILQISGLANFRQQDPESFTTLIEILRSASGAATSATAPLWVILNDPTTGVPDLPQA